MPEKMKPIVTALTAFGMSGQIFHAPFLQCHSGFDLAYMVERTHSHSKAKYPHATIIRDFNQLLEINEIELIIINTPNEYHYPMCKAALLAGKHAVVEKPFTIYSTDAQELIDLSKSIGKQIFVYHNKKLEGEFKTVQNLIQYNKLGDLEVFETHFDRYKPEIGPKKWKEEPVPGAGILYDLGPHLIDQILTLLGTPEKVHADIQIQRLNGKVPDFFKLTFHYSNHLAIAEASMLAKEPFLKYRIKGNKAEFLKYGNDPQEALLKDGALPDSPNWGREETSQWGTLNHFNGKEEKIPTEKGSYMEFYEMVYQCLVYNKPNTSLSNAINTIKIIELALKSAEENKIQSFNT
jgi:predicted dehydrogenase